MLHRRKSRSSLRHLDDKIKTFGWIRPKLLVILAMFISIGSVCSQEQEPSEPSDSAKTPENIPQKAKLENSDERSLPPPVLDYILRNYIQTSSQSQHKYQVVYGNPEKARLILIAWTSLGCSACSEIHKTLLHPLQSVSGDHSDFALMIRDCPHTPISLTASAMIWACESATVKGLMDSLHHDLQWIATSEESLDGLEKQINQQFPEYSKAAKNARHNDASKESIFQARLAEKASLHLTKFPTIIVLEKQNGEWKGWRIEDPDGHELKNALMESLNTGRFFKGVI